MSHLDLNPTHVLPLEDGSQIALVDRLGAKDLSSVEKARNIYLLDPGGFVRWQIKTSFDAEGDPFTSIFWEAGTLQAYRWDGGVYEIDISTGEGRPKYLAR